eukprot:g1195.t1
MAMQMRQQGGGAATGGVGGGVGGGDGKKYTDMPTGKTKKGKTGLKEEADLVMKLRSLAQPKRVAPRPRRRSTWHGLRSPKTDAARLAELQQAKREEMRRKLEEKEALGEIQRPELHEPRNPLAPEEAERVRAKKKNTAWDRYVPPSYVAPDEQARRRSRFFGFFGQQLLNLRNEEMRKAATLLQGVFRRIRAVRRTQEKRGEYGVRAAVAGVLAERVRVMVRGAELRKCFVAGEKEAARVFRMQERRAAPATMIRGAGAIGDHLSRHRNHYEHLHLLATRTQASLRAAEIKIETPAGSGTETAENQATDVPPAEGAETKADLGGSTNGTASSTDEQNDAATPSQLSPALLPPTTAAQSRLGLYFCGAMVKQAHQLSEQLLSEVGLMQNLRRELEGGQALFVAVPDPGATEEARRKKLIASTKARREAAKEALKAAQAAAATAAVTAAHLEPLTEEFIVSVKGARGLAKADTFGKSDPYAKVLADGNELGRTEVQWNTLDPMWDQDNAFALKVPVGGASGSTPPLLEVEIHDKDKVGADDLMGHASLDLKTLAALGGATAELALLPRAGGKAAAKLAKGKVLVTFARHPPSAALVTAHAEASAAATATTEASKAAAIEFKDACAAAAAADPREGHGTQVAAEAAAAEAAEAAAAVANLEPLTEEFIVTVKGARGLAKADTFGKSDPYAKVLADGNELGRTEVQWNTLDPMWDQDNAFALKVPVGGASGSTPPLLEVEIHDKDKVGADDLMGHASLDLKTLAALGGATAELALLPRAGGKAAAKLAKGKVLVTFARHPPSAALVTAHAEASAAATAAAEVAEVAAAAAQAAQAAQAEAKKFDNLGGGSMNKPAAIGAAQRLHMVSSATQINPAVRAAAQEGIARFENATVGVALMREGLAEIDVAKLDAGIDAAAKAGVSAQDSAAAAASSSTKEDQGETFALGDHERRAAASMSHADLRFDGGGAAGASSSSSSFGFVGRGSPVRDPATFGGKKAAEGMLKWSKAPPKKPLTTALETSAQGQELKRTKVIATTMKNILVVLAKQATDNPNVPLSEGQSAARGLNLLAQCLSVFPPSSDRLKDALDFWLRGRGEAECRRKLHMISFHGTRKGGVPPAAELAQFVGNGSRRVRGLSLREKEQARGGR